MVESPCVGQCAYNQLIDSCRGCGRTLEQIANWYKMTDGEKQAVIDELTWNNND